MLTAHPDERAPRSRALLLGAAGAAVVGAAALLPFSGFSPFGKQAPYTSIKVATDTDPGDGFGSSVAVDGDVLVVGAFRDSDTEPRGGGAYVFERSAERWQEAAKLQVPDAQAGDQAGFSVALRDRWLAVGATGSFGKQSDGSRTDGAVHVFERQTDTWAYARTLLSPSSQPDERFGFAVAIDAGRLLVGARGTDADAGAAYVFELADPGDPGTRIEAPDRSAGDRFGEAVAFADGVMVIGAPGKDGADAGTNAKGDGVEDSGGVYLFAQHEGAIAPRGDPTIVDPPESRGGAQFGVGVATDGRRVLIGASHWAHNRTGGSVWLVSRNEAGNWMPARALPGGAVERNTMPGFRVAIDGERAVASAHLDAGGDDRRATEAGSVVVYDLSTTDVAEPRRVAADDGRAHDVYGIALALDGGTLAIGAEAADAAGKDSGGLYLERLP